jgi:hypothetical protein
MHGAPVTSTNMGTRRANNCAAATQVVQGTVLQHRKRGVPTITRHRVQGVGPRNQCPELWVRLRVTSRLVLEEEEIRLCGFVWC